MNNPASLSIATILRKGLPLYLQRYGSLPKQHFDAINAINACRTPNAGVHLLRCPHCGHSEIVYNSCRNRHCPHCQYLKALQWADARSSELLPIPYFHIVFTIPHELNRLALQNPSVFYNLMFRAVSESLLELGHDKKWLGATIGFFAILHTWSQTLIDHLHIHCVVPGGGVAPDKKHFIRSRPDFLFPVTVLSKLFRGKILAYLKDAIDKNTIQFHGDLIALTDPDQLKNFFDILYKKEFVVYSKQTFAGPDAVVQYLSRYTHRVAIANHRIKEITDTAVSFSFRDRSDNNTQKTMTLDIVEFIRRFLLHILPPHFVKIRYFGFMANRIRNHMIQLCLKLLEDLCTMTSSRSKVPTGFPCPACHKALLLFFGFIRGKPPG